ncbi:MAG: lytic transglycosylase domain-containing protein [bacterium]|nr:lytic transglycosylase domain-containing protein [bacterium]
MIKILPVTYICLAFLMGTLHAEKIIVKHEEGRICVSNMHTNNNQYVTKSKRVQFKKTYGSTYTAVPSFYLAKIKKLSKKYKVKESLIIGVARAESSFNPLAVSKKGAVGIMQLMPATARQYGVVNRYNASQNMEAGVKHLKYLQGKYNSIPLVLAAYNAGEEAVRKYKGVPPYRETRNYIKRVMKFMGMPYSSNYKSNSRKKIYQIISSDGKRTITDTLPPRVDGVVTIID